MSDYKKVQTSAEVWAVIHARHREDLEPYGSFSDPTGTFNGGPGLNGRMDTSYALNGSNYPVIEIRTTWDIVNGSHERHNVTTQYWLCIALED